MPSPTVLTAISDFFFAAKVEATLKAHGYTVVKAGSAADIDREITDDAPACLVIDLDHKRLDAMQVIEQLKGDTAVRLRVLAYTNHGNVEGIRRALALGADKVVARSELSAHLPQLVAGLSAGH
ncbi:MAG: response regulator [Nitrospirota bacterium]|jgi:DNA-binding response OmpR family regulator